MINWKIVAVFAVFAAVLAILSGGVGGVPFFEIMLRAIIWSIVFAGLGVVLNLVLNKYLPELLEMTGGEQYGKSEESEFEAIIPEENPHAKGERKRNNSLDDDTADVDSDAEGIETVLELEEEGDTTYAQNGSADTKSGEVDEESVFESAPDEGDIAEKPKKTAEGIRSLDSTDETMDIEDIDDEDVRSITEEPMEKDDLDELPEIDSFSSSFSHVGDESDAGTESFEVRNPFGRTRIDPKVSELVQDPSKTAKAIHTWIERDRD
ncbi:MAG: hypothetical protein JW881_12490 [Spirochaetales bacterium]|nr:hypothetical protein [Spirochaetales bacterium]